MASNSPFHIKKGALHKQLGFPKDAPIPTYILIAIKKATVGAKVKGHTVTPLLKKRANFALNARKW